jgi:alpha-1,6-mannosyltransferase
MKTLHLTNAYHATSGGIRTFYDALVRDAAAHGRHVRLVVPGAHDRVEDVSSHARIYTIAAPPSPVVDRRYRLVLPHRFLLPDRGPVWKILRDEQPDLIEICDKYALCYLAGVLRKRQHQGHRPVLAGLTCERMDDGLRAFTRGARVAEIFARWYLKHVYVPQMDVHIANSRYTAEELPVNARHPRPAYVRPMGVDTSTFTPARRSHYRRAALRARLGVPHGAPLLLYAGRLSTEKNVDLLPPLVEHLTSASAHLVVAGDGPLRRSLERLAAGSRARIHFRGHLADRAALADLMTDADLFVHPNPREPFGIAPLEAMAAGLPVVVPDRGGVTTYATAANAWPAPATVRGLAGAALAAWQDPAERDRRRQRALFTAAAYQWPLVTGAFFDLYDDLVASATHSWRRSRESADADPDRRDADPRPDRSTAPAES